MTASCSCASMPVYYRTSQVYGPANPVTLKAARRFQQTLGLGPDGPWLDRFLALPSARPALSSWEPPSSSGVRVFRRKAARGDEAVCYCDGMCY